jgi:hypothetical protein
MRHRRKTKLAPGVDLLSYRVPWEDAAADRASMIEVEEMLLRGLNAERMI